MTNVKPRKKSNNVKREALVNGSVKGNGNPEKSESIVGKLTAEARQKLIQEAAYWRAQARNFEGDAELDDWLAAEAEMNEQCAEATGLT